MQNILQLTKTLKGKIVVAVVLCLVGVLFFFLLRSTNLEVLVFASNQKDEPFLVSVEVLASDGQEQKISLLTRQLVKAGQPSVISLAGLPNNTKKLTLWIIHPEFRYSRVDVPVPSRWSVNGTVRIAPIAWQQEIKYGVADYEEALAHVKRLYQVYLPAIPPQERRSLVQAMGEVNRIVVAADRDLRRPGTNTPDYSAKSKALNSAYHQLLTEFNNR
jgi:hypothetical protein